MSEQRLGSRLQGLDGLKEGLLQKKAEIQEGAISWAANNRPRCPWRQPGRTPYEVLIGEVCLKEVNPTIAIRIHHRLLEHFVSPQALAQSTQRELSDILSDFRVAEFAEQLRALADGLLREEKGEMLSDSRSILKVSNLQHYSVRAIMCFGHGLPVAVVDSNVERTFHRLFANALPLVPEQGLIRAMGEALLADREPQLYNCGLLDLAGRICKDRHPICARCTLHKACDRSRGVS